MIEELIKEKRIRKADIFGSTLFLGIILILINILSLLFYKRFDLTTSQKYSLSLVTKKKLQNLDDLVNIKAYFSKQLPPRFQSVKQEVIDFLNDYQSYSKNKLKINYFDPITDQKYEQEALSYGVPQLQFSDIEKDKFQVQNGYLGLVILYEDRYEVLPVVENIQNLEYDLTSAILKVLNKEKKMIALFSHQPENEFGLTPSDDQFQFLKKYLEKQYQVINISDKEEKEFDKNLNSLIVIVDQDKISDYNKFQIDQLIMSGKSVLFLINGVSIGDGLVGEPANHNLSDLLEHYGAKINNDLILDSYNDIASFQSGYNTFLTPYPFWPKIRKTGFASKNPITAKLETITFQWPSSITLNKSKQEEANFETLIKTSKKSWTTEQITNLSPQQNFNPSETDYKENIVSVLISGKIKSFYTDKEIPKKENVEEIEVKTKPVVKEVKNARLIIISNNNFLKNNFLSRNQEGLIFFLNSLDYLNSETDLMQIRSKMLSDQPLPELTDNSKLLIRWLNIVAPLILVVIAFFTKKYLEQKKDYEIKELIR